MAKDMAKEFWHSWGQLTVLVLTVAVAAGSTAQLLKDTKGDVSDNKKSIADHAAENRQEFITLRERLRLLESNQKEIIALHKLYTSQNGDMKVNISGIRGSITTITSVMGDMKADIASMKAHIETLEAAD